MRFTNKLIVATFVSSTILFTGCSKTTNNGISVPNKAMQVKRMKYKVYVDNESILKRESKLLETIQNKLTIGLNTYIHYKMKNNINKDITLESKYQIVPLKNRVNLHAGILNSDSHSTDKLMNSFELKESTLKIKGNFNIVDRELISKKKYTNAHDIVLDYMNILLGIENSFNKGYLAKNMATDIFLLDGNKLRENKLVLVPITKVYSIKDKTKNLLNYYGYQVINDKNKADKVIDLDLYAFTHLNKFVSNVNSRRHVTGGNGKVGAAVLALDLLGTSTPRPNKLSYMANAKVYDSIKKEKEEKSEIILAIKESYGLVDFNWEYYEKYLKDDRYFNSSIASLIYFMETGKTKDKEDMILSVSEKTKKGFLN